MEMIRTSGVSSIPYSLRRQICHQDSLQHADLPTQEKYLPMIRQAEKDGKTLSSNLALLEDRRKSMGLQPMSEYMTNFNQAWDLEAY